MICSPLGHSQVSRREEAKALWEKDLAAGYHPSEAKDRVMHYAQTGIALPDPTEKYWPALINQESGGKQSAVSPVGATGIAQVMPSTGPEAAALAGLKWDPVAFKNDAVYNAKLGRAYLRKQMADNGNDPALALASYNAGPGAVRKAGGDLSKLPAETQNYVPSIMNKADQGMQQDLDSPEAVAQAKEALMSPRDRARKAYETVLSQGGSPEDAKAAAMQFAAPQQALAAQQAAPTPSAQPTAAPDGTPSEPTFAQGLQNDIEKVYQTDPVTAGMGRSLAGTIQGVRKLYNQATGDEAKVSELNADEQRSRDFWNKVDPEGSGFSQGDFGRVAGDVTQGGVLGKVLKGGILGNAAAGAVQGGLQPTTEGESQAVNAGVGGAIGGVIGAAGKGISALIGRADPERQALSTSLRSQGVDVPVGQSYDSPLGTALRKMGGEKGSGPASEVSLTKKLAERMGIAGQDITNSSLEANERRAGSAIGNLFKNDSATPGRDFARKIIDIGQEYHLSGPIKNSDPVISMADHLLELARPGRQMSGKEYQALRTGLSANSITGGAAEKMAMGGMKRALDDMFQAQNLHPEAAGLRSEYRLSKILRKGSGIPAEGMTAKALRNRIEGAANKGQVDPAVRGLLDETNMLIPGSKIGGDAVAGAGDNMVIRGLDRPGVWSALQAATRGVSGPLSKFYDKGYVQSIVNNPAARTSLSSLLRGGAIPPATPKGE
jgi:soluble lytic murein transglycosylase-like protein